LPRKRVSLTNSRVTALQSKSNLLIWIQKLFSRRSQPSKLTRPLCKLRMMLLKKRLRNFRPRFKPWKLVNSRLKKTKLKNNNPKINEHLPNS